MTEETVTFGEIAADSAVETSLGVFLSHQSDSTIEVISVAVEQTTNADAEFNILLDGEYVFSTAQSVSAGDTVETFIPDQNKHSVDGSLAIEVTSAGTGGDVLNGGIRIRHGE